MTSESGIRVMIPGDPVAKARPRATRTKNGARMYTPAKTRKWEKNAGLCAAAVMSGRPAVKDPVRIEVEAVLPVPVSWPKWKQAAACDGNLLATGKPDGDNIGKAAADALNEIVFADDSQIIDTRVRKRYTRHEEQPHVLVSIFRVPGMRADIQRKPTAA